MNGSSPQRGSWSHLTDDSCSICLELVTPASDCGLLCKHVHHKKCILKIQGQPLCPICRGPLTGSRLTEEQLSDMENYEQLPESNYNHISGLPGLLFSTMSELIRAVTNAHEVRETNGLQSIYLHQGSNDSDDAYSSD